MNVNLLEAYIPSAAIHQTKGLIHDFQLEIKVKNERKTRHGDYKLLPNGKHQITVNSNLNRFRFLITLLHEIAHLKAFDMYGTGIKPHGKEWKLTFKSIMLPFLNPSVFPNELLPILALHFKSPKASSDTDAKLLLALKKYDIPNNKTHVIEIDEGEMFLLYNGKRFVRGTQRRKRIECKNVENGRIYLFNPLAEVELIA